MSIPQKKPSLAETHPSLAVQWSTKNTVGAGEITAGSHKKVWWVCDKGHEWLSEIKNRTSGRNCPYCGNKLVLAGFNDLATTHPNLAQEWSNKNEYGPESIMPGSGKKVWWQCTAGHEWKTTPNSRTTGTGSNCPVCFGRVAEQGVNDLYVTHPSLVLEWSDRNMTTPREYKSKSNKSVWWKCAGGHEWEAVIAGRVAGNGCPYCSGRLPIIGETDLATTLPWITEFYSVNNPAIESVTSHSSKKIELVCAKGHTWFPYVYAVSRAIPSCPKCRDIGISHIEKTILDLLNQHYTIQPQYEVRYQDGKKRILTDGFFEHNGKKVIFEYDGAYWHRDILLKDTYKTRILLEQGYFVIRIRENNLPLVPLAHENLLQLQWEPSDPETLVNTIVASL